jgi:hypothetical protein
MPHTSQKKKSSGGGRRKAPSKAVHTKRCVIEDEDGWSHVVGGRKLAGASTVAKLKTEKGDFEMHGCQYMEKTLETLRKEYAGCKRVWEESEACEALKVELARIGDDGDDGGGGTGGGRKIENVVSLGLGSFQTMSAAYNRASFTQLAALETIMSALHIADVPVVQQDPAFTPLDKEFLGSMGQSVHDNPKGYDFIGPDTLVYAIHCYPSIYNSVGDRAIPAIFIGNDLADKSAALGQQYPCLESLINSLELTFAFPQFRTDFSDTVVCVRKAGVTGERIEAMADPTAAFITGVAKAMSDLTTAEHVRLSTQAATPTTPAPTAG